MLKFPPKKIRIRQQKFDATPQSSVKNHAQWTFFRKAKLQVRLPRHFQIDDICFDQLLHLRRQLEKIMTAIPQRMHSKKETQKNETGGGLQTSKPHATVVNRLYMVTSMQQI